MTDETTRDTQASIRCAAFEAAYLDMTPPNPASHRFALLVAWHEERLRREWAAMSGRAAGTLRGGGANFPSD
ncbi:MAG: hypothetical protein M3Q03_21395 [Chloroflexota bacterium]|nr:hypothetical protein [Chloroflexota bacterium]